MTFKSAKKNFASLPALGNSVDDLRCALDTGIIYRWTGSIWSSVGSRFNIFGIPQDTDALVEGTTNLFFTDARAVAAQNNNVDGGSANSVYGGLLTIDGGSA